MELVAVGMRSIRVSLAGVAKVVVMMNLESQDASILIAF
jgi:hypothetical protein